ncbi:hypothetical protein BGY98DRAFT_648688 [Russula aff. rugulosa BPL654]|nr:hypothetical protein BGY98DRAFT_648688 [Russula aff. rugulosa BPL654]
MAGKSRHGNTLHCIWNVADGHPLVAKGYVPHSVPHTQRLRTPSQTFSPLRCLHSTYSRWLFVYQIYMPRRSRIGGSLPGPSDLMSAAQLAVQLTEGFGGAMQLGPAITVLRVILDTVEQVKSNRDSCLRLARRAIVFVLNIRDTMEGKWDFAPPSLKESVDRFEWLLLSIRDWMRDLARTNLFTRFIKKDRIKDKITDFELQLIDAVSQFQCTVLVELQHIMSESLRATLSQETQLVRQVQEMHSQMIVGFRRGLRPQDDDGFPLVHRSELVLHGMPPMGGGWWQNLAEASINGRPVLIKRYDGREGKKDDLAFLKSVWDARFPQLYGVSQQTKANPEFIILHNVGITDLRAFIAPYLKEGHLLEVAAIATRIAEHLRAGLTLLASTGRWPAIYDQKEQPSLAMLSSLVVNNRGNLVIGGDIASDRQPQNHRGPLVWLCHEIFGERYPGSILGVDEDDRTMRAANWPIKSPALFYSPVPHHRHKSQKRSSSIFVMRIGLRLSYVSSGRRWPRGGSMTVVVSSQQPLTAMSVSWSPIQTLRRPRRRSSASETSVTSSDICMPRS